MSFFPTNPAYLNLGDGKIYLSVAFIPAPHSITPLNALF